MAEPEPSLLPPSGYLEGRLLVATPLVGGGIFTRSVVLLVSHDADGAVGLVLTAPGRLPVRQVLPGWASLVGDPAVVFTGGPVEQGGALALGRAGARVRLLNLGGQPQEPARQLDGVRVFAGYAGWSAAQLEDEVAQGAWCVVEALPDDPFTAHPQRLWRDVLRRQTGRAAVLSTLPGDPLLN